MQLLLLYIELAAPLIVMIVIKIIANKSYMYRYLHVVHMTMHMQIVHGTEDIIVTPLEQHVYPWIMHVIS